MYGSALQLYLQMSNYSRLSIVSIRKYNTIFQSRISLRIFNTLLWNSFSVVSLIFSFQFTDLNKQLDYTICFTPERYRRCY